MLIVALSTMAPQYRALYSHARELSEYMMRHLEFKKLATLYSSSLPPAVAIADNGVVRLHSNGFYHHAAGRDIIVFCGDGAPFDDQQQYGHAVLSFAQQLGVAELVSIGARWAEAPVPTSVRPRVVGYSTDDEGVKELERLGVLITRNEPGPFFANLVVGMASQYDMRGYKLGVDHGEPIPHAKSLIEIFAVLSKMASFEVSMAELEERARETASQAPESLPEVRRERGGIYG